MVDVRQTLYARHSRVEGNLLVVGRQFGYYYRGPEMEEGQAHDGYQQSTRDQGRHPGEPRNTCQHDRRIFNLIEEKGK